MAAQKKYVLVTGGGTFLGDNIAAALLAEGAEVTLLVRPDAEDKLDGLRQRLRLRTADVWNPASLKGRARGHSLVIHTVGSMVADPAQGLNYNWLNFVSARNVANMCVSDGVPHMVLMSSVRAPWVNGQYIRSKREAERYIGRVGLRSTIIRAPIAYMPGRSRSFFYRLVGIMGRIPPLSWLFLGRMAPLPVDVLARGVARIALDPDQHRQIYYAGNLRKRGKAPSAYDLSFNAPTPPANRPVRPFDLLDEDTPFGWTPPHDEK